jgi:hypothetical protein
VGGWGRGEVSRCRGEKATERGSDEGEAVMSDDEEGQGVEVTRCRGEKATKWRMKRHALG